MATVLLVSGLALGAVGTALLRAAKSGDRRLVFAGWAALAAMAAAFTWARGAETGLPAAIAIGSTIALALVSTSATWRPWRSRHRPAADDVSPARREAWARAASRWIAAGPIGLISAIVSVAALAIGLGGTDADALIFAMTAIVILWGALAAWAFSTRKPLRTLSVISALGVLGGSAAAASTLLL